MDQIGPDQGTGVNVDVQLTEWVFVCTTHASSPAVTLICNCASTLQALETVVNGIENMGGKFEFKQLSLLF